jgi:hypothetical protein
VQAHIDAAREQAEVERDFNGEAWDAEQNRSAALQEQLDAAREQVAAVEAVVAQAQHPALRCKTLAEDVELIWGGRTQAREACEQWKAERDAAVERAAEADELLAEVRADYRRALAAARQQLDQVREYADLLSRTSQQRPEAIAVDVAWKLRQILDTPTAGGETS